MYILMSVQKVKSECRRSD